MSSQTIKTLIAAVLLFHGLGHLGALGGTIYHHVRHTQGDWLSDHSWLLPGLTPDTAKVVAGVFWALSLVGFVAAALAFWGAWLPFASWSTLAVASAVVSTVGIVLFGGTWPIPNTIAALAINIAVLVTQWWTHWPASDQITN